MGNITDSNHWIGGHIDERPGIYRAQLNYSTESYSTKYDASASRA